MGYFTAYMLEASIFLSLLFLAYKFTVGRLKCFSLMRGVMLSIYPLCMILPALLNLDIKQDDAIGSADFSGLITTTRTIQVNQTHDAVSFGEIIVAVAITGMCLTGLITIIGLCRLMIIYRKSREKELGDIKVRVFTSRNASPFSFGSKIYMSQSDYEERNGMLLCHELAHIRHGHWMDLAIARLFCVLQWWNPFAWLMTKELHLVHEFQADEAVLSKGFNQRDYQYFLIKKATGTCLQTLADSLTHSKLKTRLTMMKKENSSLKSRLAGMMMVPAIAIGAGLLSIPAVAQFASEIRNTALTLPKHSLTADKVSEKISNEKIRAAAVATTKNKPAAVSEPTVSPVNSDEATPIPAYGEQSADEDNVNKTSVKEETGNIKPRLEIDGVIMDENFDMNSLNPSQIESMTIVKNNPDFPNGLIKIKLKNGETGQKSENHRKSDDNLPVSVKSIDNIDGTHLVFQFLTDEEIHLKDVIWTINGKDYKPESVSSSFSKSGNNGYQVIKIDLSTTIKKFWYGKDKVSFTRDNGERESFIIPLNVATSPN